MEAKKSFLGLTTSRKLILIILYWSPTLYTSNDLPIMIKYCLYTENKYIEISETSILQKYLIYIANIGD